MSSNQPKGYTIKDFTLELDPATSPGKFQDARKKESGNNSNLDIQRICLLYTSPSPRDQRGARMPSSA